MWESSHPGGHRFGPTALVLPTGYLYWLLDVASAVAARKAAGLGEVETGLCRGRATTAHAGDGRAWDVDVWEEVGAARPNACGALCCRRWC